MFVECEFVCLVVMVLVCVFDEGVGDVVIQVFNVKVCCCDVYQLLINEVFQMYGGIGMIDEYDIGLFMKWVCVLEMIFGDVVFYCNCFVELCGF